MKAYLRPAWLLAYPPRKYFAILSLILSHESAHNTLNMFAFINQPLSGQRSLFGRTQEFLRIFTALHTKHTQKVQFHVRLKFYSNTVLGHSFGTHTNVMPNTPSTPKAGNAGALEVQIN